MDIATDHNHHGHVVKKESIFHKLYVTEVISGLLTTLKFIFRPKSTINYPEEKRELGDRYRGEHRLKINEKGQIKCVACYMCATACPVGCIHIEAKEAPADWVGRDKIPDKFEIDELRCIFCGFCIEACPKDAIEMIKKIPRVYYTRPEFIYDKDLLLNNEGESSKWQVV